MSYEDFRSRFFELPIELGRSYYTTRVGGFAPPLYKDCLTGKTYAGIGINESKLKKMEKNDIWPNSKCFVFPIDENSSKIITLWSNYPTVIIPLSRYNYPYALSMSPKGEAVLPVWPGESGPETLNSEIEKGSQILLSFEAFKKENLFTQFIENIQPER